MNKYESMSYSDIRDIIKLQGKDKVKKDFEDLLVKKYKVKVFEDGFSVEFFEDGFMIEVFEDDSEDLPDGW